MSASQSKLRILVVDDEAAIRRMLSVALEPSGFAVSQAESGTVALDAVRRNEADLMLLDLGLPDLNGLDVIRRIRLAGSAIPIIVLSSRADESGKVEAFDLGADDYLTKPFGIEELLARIRALQRYRLQPQAQPTTVEAGELRVNLNRRSVTVRGIEVKLSPREYDLLRLLITHAGKVLTHGYILRNVWGSGSDIQYLRIYISSIRRKIELSPDQPAILLTEQGVGYRLCLTGQAAASYEGGPLAGVAVGPPEITSL
jgi:two-component system, OmpR family, KDP operon response regulator KdpE